MLSRARLTTRLALICWIALLVLTGLKFNRERKLSRREPGFTPPESNGISYANVYTGHEAQDEERYSAEPKPIEEPQQVAYDPHSGYAAYEHQPAQIPVMEHRASMDLYGSAGDRTSRTMQIAYNDPCKLCSSTNPNKALMIRCRNPCESYHRSICVPSPARSVCRAPAAGDIFTAACNVCFAKPPSIWRLPLILFSRQYT
jgi:hypothetical protein